MIQGFGYLFYNSLKDLANNRFSPSIIAGYGPHNSMQTAINNILAIYNTDIEAENVTLFAPPLGFKFGIISSNVFTEYEYKKGNFEYTNTAEGGAADPGIVASGAGVTLSDTIPEGEGDAGSSTIALSTKGAYALALMIRTASGGGINSISFNGEEYASINTETGTATIPLAAAPTTNPVSLGNMGLMSAADKAKLDSVSAISELFRTVSELFIEVYEDGLYNVDANFEVEPTGVSVLSSSSSSLDVSTLLARIEKIILILGDLYDEDYVTFSIDNL